MISNEHKPVNETTIIVKTKYVYILITEAINITLGIHKYIDTQKNFLSF